MIEESSPQLQDHISSTGLGLSLGGPGSISFQEALLEWDNDSLSNAIRIKSVNDKKNSAVV